MAEPPPQMASSLVRPTSRAAREARLLARPDRFVGLLLQASLLPDEKAGAAWRQWKAERDLDAASWAEVRLLATLLTRLRTLDPDYEHAGRLQGFRRYIFTHAHRTLNATRPMLRALGEAGIEMVLLKGAARLAEDSSLFAERFVADVDVLIRPDDWARALAVGRAQNWVPKLPADAPAEHSPESLYAFAHSLDYTSDGGSGAGRLDLHHHARHMCRNPGEDDAIWSHSRPGSFLGVPVRLPSPTDQIVIMLAHASRFSAATPSGDWGLDLAALLEQGQVDWQRLRRDALASNTQAFLASTLLYARRRLGLEVPQPVTAALAAAVTDAHWGELDYLSRAHYGSVRNPSLARLARDTAIRRAKAAAKRQPPAATGRRPWILPRAVVAHAEGSRSFARIDVPRGLRPDDRLTLEAALRLGPGAAKISVTSMRMVLEVWTRPADRTQMADDLVQLRLCPASLLLIMGGARELELRVAGSPAVSDVRLRWRAEPLDARLKRRLRKLAQRAAARFRQLKQRVPTPPG